MAEKNKKKQIKLGKTAAGAQQYINIDPSKDTFNQIRNKIDKAQVSVERDENKLSYNKFIEKYGKSPAEAWSMLENAKKAALSKYYKDKYGKDDSAGKMYDELEKSGKESYKKIKKLREDYQKKSKGSTDYRKGGMVLSSKDNRKKK
jgi:hypothetical protein